MGLISGAGFKGDGEGASGHKYRQGHLPLPQLPWALCVLKQVKVALLCLCQMTLASVLTTAL